MFGRRRWRGAEAEEVERKHKEQADFSVDRPDSFEGRWHLRAQIRTKCISMSLI